MSKIVGIIGGMGPMSTVELMRKIIARTPARREQDHLRLLVDNRPEIPDRTEFLLGKGPSPVPYLQESARLLEQWGAQLLGIACNTAHAFVQDIQQVVSIPVLNMLDLLAQKLQSQLPPGAPVVLLATTGSIRTGLFQRHLPDFKLLVPESNAQEELVMKAVYGEQGVKAGGDLEKNRALILQALESLKSANPKAIIAGCTEIGMLLENTLLDLPVYNPLDALAEEIVATAFEKS